MNKKRFQSRWQNKEFFSQIFLQLSTMFSSKHYIGPAEFRGLSIGLDGQPPEIGFSDFREAHIEEIDLSYGRFSCEFSHSLFLKVNFTEGYFDTCGMQSSKFFESKFFRATIGAPKFDDAVFENCDFSEGQFRGRGLKEYGGRRTKFISCSFSHTVLRGLELRACQFFNCHFESTVFEKCLLSGVKFIGSHPALEQFSQCHLHHLKFDEVEIF